MVNSVAMPIGLSPPNRAALLAELLLPFDMMRFSLSLPSLIAAPRGDGRPIILLPGYGASEISFAPFEHWLTRIGYSTTHWGLGRNRGKVDDDTARMVAQLRARAAAPDFEPVTLIGWSLGGVIARESARLAPELVREVITMGTPLIGGPKYTSAAQRYSRQEMLDLDQYEQEVHRRNSLGLSQPLTVIYTPRDGIVSPASSQDIYNPQARMIAVDGGHFGLGINPRVWRIVADTLAAH